MRADERDHQGDAEWVLHGVERRDKIPRDLDAHPREGHPVLLLQGLLQELAGAHPGIRDRARGRARALDGGELPGLLGFFCSLLAKRSLVYRRSMARRWRRGGAAERSPRPHEYLTKPQRRHSPLRGLRRESSGVSR